MGFKFSSFATGALKSLASTVKEQSATADADAKRYIEAGVAEGKAANKTYRATNKRLIDLGNQLDSRGLDSNQIKLVLKGGEASATSFIKAADDAVGDDPTTDISGWVNVAGKPSSTSWQDYITGSIQGTPDKAASQMNYTAPKTNSIMGSMFGSGTGGRSSRLDTQSAKIGNAMGIDVESTIAAGAGNYSYDESMQVSGSIKMEDKAGSLAYSSALEAIKFVREANPLRIQQLQASLENAESDEERARFRHEITVANEKLDVRKRQAEATALEWNIENNLTVKELEARLAKAETSMRESGTPSSYERGIILMSDKLAKELDKGEAQDPALVDLYTKNKDRYTAEYLALRSAQSNAVSNITYSTYNNMFNDIFSEELSKVQPGGSTSWVTTPNGAGGVSINWVGKYSKGAYDAYSGARAKAAERFIEATAKLPAGPMKDVVNTLIENYETLATAEVKGVDGGMTAAQYKEEGYTAYTGPEMVVDPNKEYIVSHKNADGAVSSSLILGRILLDGGKAVPIEAVETIKAEPVRPGIMSNPTQQQFEGITYERFTD